MKDKTSASLEALTGLLGERQRYEEWLAALEARKSATPDSVYQKVRSDYQTRLKDVSDRLGARASDLKENIDSFTVKLQQISVDEFSRHEARQEAEVRAAVGEYADEEWQRMREESEKELSRIARDRTATETQLAELNRVFMLCTNPAAAASAPVPPAIPTPSIAPKPALQPEQNGFKRTSTSGWPQREGDSSSAAIPAQSAATGTRAAGAPPPDRKSSFEEFAPLAHSPATGAEDAKKKQEGAPGATATKSKRGGLPDLRTEQQKTLKCPECGATNYPTEWYCERCGGELATL